jgi:hypothetical protein
VSVVIGDLNGDGMPDLATANAQGNTASVFLNRGDGTFAAKRDIRTGRLPGFVAIGDLNGDGTPDLVTANFAASTSTLSVLLNKGDGTFQARHDYRTGRGPRSVAIGDLNGDGTADIVTANSYSGGVFQRETNSVSVLLNMGDGSFQAKRDSATARGSYSVAIGDLNGDGIPDLATANTTAPGTVSALLRRSDGSLLSRRDYAAGIDPRQGWADTRAVAVGDLDGDGTPDLVTANYYDGGLRELSSVNGVSVFLNKGNGSFRTHRDYRTGRGAISVAIGDLNGDGKLDLVTANPGPEDDRETTVSVLFNRGDGTFRAKLDYQTGGNPESVAIGDLNGDGKLDLATANFDRNVVSVLLNRR